MIKETICHRLHDLSNNVSLRISELFFRLQRHSAHPKRISSGVTFRNGDPDPEGYEMPAPPDAFNSLSSAVTAETIKLVPQPTSAPPPLTFSNRPPCDDIAR